MIVLLIHYRFFFFFGRNINFFSFRQVFPYQGKSHHMFLQAFLKVLLKEGYHITTVTTVPMNENFTNHKQIIFQPDITSWAGFYDIIISYKYLNINLFVKWNTWINRESKLSVNQVCCASTNLIFFIVHITILSIAKTVPFITWPV